MRRSDRLHRLITILRDGKLHRAEGLARALEVSVRTIYRDMERLMASGLPLQGTRGAGYKITQAISLPPLTLTAKEFEAMNLGLAILSGSADAALKDAALSLGDKIDAVLPPDTIAPAQAWAQATPLFADPTRNFTYLPLLRGAVNARQKVLILFTDARGARRRLVLRPLRLAYFGRIWTLIAWIEADDSFGEFRLDQLEEVEALPDLFSDEAGKTLLDFPSTAHGNSNGGTAGSVDLFG
ncbi:MAG: HTH domain-containing protein [Pseudomonadota bacterium]